MNHMQRHPAPVPLHILSGYFKQGAFFANFAPVTKVYDRMEHPCFEIYGYPGKIFFIMGMQSYPLDQIQLL